MNLNKNIAEPDNYYVPFLDLMSGIVFILMIILSTELLNIKYDTPTSSQTISNTASNEIHYDSLNPLELFKRNFVSSISIYLNNRNIKNSISKDYSNIIINNIPIFHKRNLSLTKEGKNLALGVSEAFNNNLFLKINQHEQFKKNMEYLKAIYINVYPFSSENFESAFIAKSLVFYGYLVDKNPTILSFTNSYSPHLIRISDTNLFPQYIGNNAETKKEDTLIINFEFGYPQKDTLIW
ncbi:MAG: hypothetical protein JSR85_00380 [Proteobacteria bacterium]|nr:hypothetical protein [Pseudomonadota bacterium]